MNVEPSVRVEDKLYYNRYLVDAGHPHVRVRAHKTPSPQLLTLLKACPARCYELNDIEWSHPRGGYGVLFKFG
jgi:ferredoxin like protein